MHGMKCSQNIIQNTVRFECDARWIEVTDADKIRLKLYMMQCALNLHSTSKLNREILRQLSECAQNVVSVSAKNWYEQVYHATDQ